MNSTDSARAAQHRAIFSDWCRVSPTYALRFSFVNGTFEVHYTPRWPTHPEIEPLLPSYRAALRAFFGGLLDRGIRRVGPFELNYIETR